LVYGSRSDQTRSFGIDAIPARPAKTSWSLKKTLKYLAEGKYSQAASECLRSKWAKPDPQPGQTKISYMIETGQYLK